MSKFIDGPAGGVSLHLRRSPIMLRVVRNREGQWDALDQLSDQPGPDETIFLYRLCSEVTRGFLCVRGGKGDGVDGFAGAFSHGMYRFVEPQPGDEQLRTNKAWHAWCEANKDQQIKLHEFDVAQAEHMNLTVNDEKGGE